MVSDEANRTKDEQADGSANGVPERYRSLFPAFERQLEEWFKEDTERNRLTMEGRMSLNCPDRDSDAAIAANRAVSHCAVNSETGCWEWQGATASKKPYGRFKWNGKLVLPHRVVALGMGMVEEGDGQIVMHECDNPRCCNPAHLKAGNQSQNMLDCVARGRYRLPKNEM